MNILKKILLSIAAILSLAASVPSLANPATDSIIGAGGYDLTTYFTQEKPQRGNGHHVAVVDGVTYTFASDENKKTFEANPSKFLPQYGGYCAYGVSVNKKFIADPEQYDIVDGKLYLNLDAKIRSIWLQNVPGRISDANVNWKTIANKPASEL